MGAKTEIALFEEKLYQLKNSYLRAKELLLSQQLNPSEKAYIDNTKSKRWKGNAKFICSAFLIVHIIGVLQTTVIQNASAYHYLVFHAVNVFACLFLTIYTFKDGKYTIPLINSIFVVQIAAYLNVTTLVSSIDVKMYFASIIFLLSASSSAFLYFPFSRKAGSYYLIAVLCLVILNIGIIQQQYLICASFINGMGGFYVIFLFLQTRDEKNLRQEYRNLSKILPKQILSKNISLEDLPYILRPKIRNCICIASDWRGYQKLSRELPAAKMTAALGVYYQICEELLSEYFPKGNYFSDWTADELFVVIFNVNDDISCLDISASISFSKELLIAKHNFCSGSKINFGVDIGLSMGEAIIGLLGPASHSKTTALGEVPGIARRIQESGKILRTANGEADRVIFIDNEFTKHFDESSVKTQALPKNIRDVPKQKIHYYESAH